MEVKNLVEKKVCTKCLSVSTKCARNISFKIRVKGFCKILVINPWLGQRDPIGWVSVRFILTDIFIKKNTYIAIPS